MKTREINASRRFNKFLKFILRPYLTRRFRLHHEGDFLKTLEPPYMLLANHTCGWDPFVLSMYVPHPIYFVTSSQFFRNPVLRFLLSLVGSIPKSKFISDSMTVKSILKVRKKNGLIGIFPEGARNWDGKTLPVLYPTAKLVKSLNIPVVTTVFKGMYSAAPRWSKHYRKGKVLLESKLVLKTEDIEKLDTDGIYEIITNALAHDEYEFQKENMIPFKGRKLAQSLELYIYICPHCKSIGTMKSRNDMFSCTKCGYSIRYDAYGFLCKASDTFYYDRLSDWNEWQSAHMRNLIAQADKSVSIFSNSGVILRKGSKFRPAKKIRLGELSFYKDKLVFKCLAGKKFLFNIEKMNGITVHSNNIVEFFYEGVVYRFNFKITNTSAYKWVKAAKLAKEIEGSSNEESSNEESSNEESSND